MCMYVFEICVEGIFVTFPWWLENVKSRSKIALFSNERHFEIWFPKKRKITFFWSKLSKLHKKDPILHVATTFSLKQGETRTSHGPIPHPLTSNELWLLELRIKSSHILASIPDALWDMCKPSITILNGSWVEWNLTYRLYQPNSDMQDFWGLPSMLAPQGTWSSRYHILQVY